MRWVVGDATVTAVIESEMPTSPRFLFSSVTKGDVAELATRHRWLAPHFVDDAGYLLQRVQCLVIEIDGVRIAVDTCVGNDKPRANPGWAQLQLPFLERLAEAGYAPEDIDIVLCTHLHVDHVGWNTRLVDGRWVPTFPNARYLFARTEFEHWRDTGYEGGDDIFGDSVAPVVAAGQAELVAMDHLVCPGVRLDPTPGHTPGHVSVVVESGGHRAVITGDMIHTPIQIAEVGLSSAFDTDPVQAADTRRAFLARYCGGTLVIGTHWGGPGAGHIVADGDGWSVDVDGAAAPRG